MVAQNATTLTTSAPITVTTTGPPLTGCDLTKTLHLCCIYPYHLEREVMNDCANITLWKKKNATGHIDHGKKSILSWPDAVEQTTQCYLNKTKLLVNEKFDKELAQAIYKKFTGLSKTLLNDDPWPALIKEAVEGCEFKADTNKSDAMEKFYNCSNTKLGNNCPLNYIDSRDDCDRYFEAHELCKAIKPVCTEWPAQLMLPEFCCVYPEMVSAELQKTCSTKCSTPNSPSRTVMACKNKCIDDALAYRAGTKIDFAKVAAALKANTPKGVSWDKSIDKAVAYCTDSLKGE